MKDIGFYEQEERTLQFERFSREDALKLGLAVLETLKKYPDPAAVEITVNGLVVFRYMPEGTLPDNALWLERKRNTVELMHMSSLHFLAWLEAHGETMADRKLPADDYAAGGGGFPIILKGTGVVGSVCVSGLPHEDDHQSVVDTIAAYLGK